ncbi:MAG TPA: cyclase family protein [Acidimicrobiia bacterium]|nr:cyclase family protein [Acidimicrobiia bacterium]
MTPRPVDLRPASARPAYADLPDGCAWEHLDPALGSLALLTPERVATAARLVKTGRRFGLDLPLDEPNPPFFGREPIEHTVFQLMDHVLDDRLDSFYPQGSTQWDGFGHYSHTERGYFMGRSAAEVQGGAPGIEAWAERGLAGRGVLLDVARHAQIAGDSSFVVTPDLLDQTASAQGVEIRPGDVLCVRVGWIAWYRSLGIDARAALAESSRTFVGIRIPGVGPGPALAEWCWDHGIAAIAVDNPTVEPFPPAGVDGESLGADHMVHVLVMVYLGIPMGEFFDFEALAEDCAADGVYEFLFTSKPLGIPGGIGSPPNAIALK